MAWTLSALFLLSGTRRNHPHAQPRFALVVKRLRKEGLGIRALLVYKGLARTGRLIQSNEQKPLIHERLYGGGGERI